MRKAEAGRPPAVRRCTIRKNICTHCSVGCTVIAEVSNGVWVGQEPGWDRPISRGSHCAKGAATRELVHGDRRLQYPMKLVNGQWTRISWDIAINEIGDKLNGNPRQVRRRIRSTGSVRPSSQTKAPICSASSRPSGAPTTSDHQARICHSTTVAGVANTWGYGAMTNSYTDIRNSKTHVLHRRQSGRGASGVAPAPARRQGAQSGELHRRRSAHDPHRRARDRICAACGSGTDIPVIYGMLWHIFKNGWEDKQFIEQRVYGMDDIRKEVEKWTPEEVERVTGVPGAQLERVAKMFATEKPAMSDLGMGQTQHTVGTANVRASCILLLATGNVGGPGTGANIFRGHTNVQGATDLGLDIVTLPLYYGLVEGAWRHWCARLGGRLSTG